MPKGKFIEPTTPRTYTLERLQELRQEADLAGDTASRDALSAKIVKRGGVVPTGEIPEDETKLGRFERLRRDAIEVGDTESAEKLGVIIAEVDRLMEIKTLAREDGKEDIVQTADSRIGKILGGGFDLKDEHIPDYAPDPVAEPHTPHEGRGLVGDHCTREVAQVNKPEPGSPEWMKIYPYAACEATVGGCTRSKDDPLCSDCNNGNNYISPPLDGGMDVHTATDESSDTPVADLMHGDTKIVMNGGSAIRERLGAESPDAPQSDEARLEGPEATEPVNDGTASISAVNTIKVKNYVLAEIPAKDGGKVTIHDVRRYERMLAEV